MKKLTTSEFIARSRKVHGDYYDYSLVSYVSNHTPVKIICPIHGEFLQQPSQHFVGQGCPLCGKNRKKRLIRGVAYNDTEYTISDIAFRRWKDLLRRCYPQSEHEKNFANRTKIVNSVKNGYCSATSKHGLMQITMKDMCSTRTCFQSMAIRYIPHLLVVSYRKSLIKCFKQSIKA